MAKTSTRGRKASPEAAAFRKLLRNASATGDSTSRVQRVMLALGYSVSMTPAGFPAFERKTEHKGIPVTVWVMTREDYSCPASLLDPVFVGFYSTEGPLEMVSNEEHPRLLDYLLKYHDKALGAEKDTTGTGN
ncbi:hypothetical protein [Oleidesulfovibrio sp.]|uniref:hypothetical protein n=1 Tax=Oleidesulfovibrio sp. TaxID=2909707 RepID=UPI003A869684